jgi:hypothetical protein
MMRKEVFDMGQDSEHYHHFFSGLMENLGCYSMYLGYSWLKMWVDSAEDAGWCGVKRKPNNDGFFCQYEFWSWSGG